MKNKKKGAVVQLDLESVTCSVPYRASYVRIAKRMAAAAAAAGEPSPAT